MREFIRDVGGPVAIAQLVVFVWVLMMALFGAGLLIGDL